MEALNATTALAPTYFYWYSFPYAVYMAAFFFAWFFYFILYYVFSAFVFAGSVPMYLILNWRYFWYFIYLWGARCWCWIRFVVYPLSIVYKCLRFVLRVLWVVYRVVLYVCFPYASAMFHRVSSAFNATVTIVNDLVNNATVGMDGLPGAEASSITDASQTVLSVYCWLACAFVIMSIGSLILVLVMRRGSGRLDLNPGRLLARIRGLDPMTGTNIGPCAPFGIRGWGESRQRGLPARFCAWTPEPPVLPDSWKWIIVLLLMSSPLSVLFIGLIVYVVPVVFVLIACLRKYFGTNYAIEVFGSRELEWCVPPDSIHAPWDNNTKILVPGDIRSLSNRSVSVERQPVYIERVRIRRFHALISVDSDPLEIEVIPNAVYDCAFHCGFDPHLVKLTGDALLRRSCHYNLDPGNTALLYNSRIVAELYCIWLKNQRAIYEPSLGFQQ